MGLEAELKPGDPGQLAVAVDGEILDTRPEGFWRRLLMGNRPDEEKVVAMLRKRMA